MRAKIVAFSQYAVTVFAFGVAVILAEKWFRLGWQVFGIAFAFTFILTWSHALAVPGWPRKLAIRTMFLVVSTIMYVAGYVLGYFLYDHSFSAASLTGLVVAIIAACLTAYLDHVWNSQDGGRRKRLESGN